MSNKPIARDLADWLTYIESLHPKSIAMGLQRVNQVIKRLKLYPDFKIITVAGTNGKGSTCATLENIYLNAGYKVGCYTSPHLMRYNERVRVNGQEVEDLGLCNAFSAIEIARLDDETGNTELTYFEVGTLAAIWHFMREQVDIAILEVGLGGRLDAVNAFEPDCAIVTSVDLDHMEFLGDTREKIGFEKAGVFRPQITAICGDKHPPASLIEHARQIKADLKLIDIDFSYKSNGPQWQFLQENNVRYELPTPIMQGDFQLNNAACAIAAVEAMQISVPVPEEAIIKAMQNTRVAGRFQTISSKPQVILDVAHNPHAARALAENLQSCKVTKGKTIAVFAMLADKDIAGVITALKDQIDVWYIAGIEHPRGAQAYVLKGLINQLNPEAICEEFESAAEAYLQACIDAGENDKIVVFGSFFTVSNVMQAFSNRTH